jgi:hypothetical protein
VSEPKSISGKADGVSNEDDCGVPVFVAADEGWRGYVARWSEYGILGGRERWKVDIEGLVIRLTIPRYGEGERGVLKRNILILKAFQELFEVLIFRLGSQILGFELSDFIFKLEDPSRRNRRGIKAETNILDMPLLTFPECTLCGTILLLTF